MNDPNFDEFLAGTADDQQHRDCEDLLSNPETIVNCQPTMGDDSLISALRLAGESPPDAAEIESLVSQVEKLAPNRAISSDELAEVLDPAISSGELGRIDRFRVIEFLASGGMGLVFRAIDPNLNRDVCIKLLNPKLNSDKESKLRFERESREAARMQSARIVAILEVGNQKGLPFLVMPMLEGASLRSVLDRVGRMHPDLALKVTKQIAQGLEHAHNRNLLHRDIKPDNLWLTPTNDIIILDFGLARSTDRQFENEAPVTRHGTIIGTPSYMSPEQVTGKALDQRSDLFSVGIVLVEMLTGESPFKKSNLFSTMMSVAGETLDLSDLDSMQEIPSGIQSLAENLLQKNPDERLPSAGKLIKTIDRIEESPNTAISQANNLHHGGGWAKSIAAGVAGILLTVALMTLWVLNDKGTLVVRTDDPDVEVKVAGEIVSVFDPVSERKYQIRIGETPLPSGIYQLESEPQEDGLSFSSQTIAIRRGEKTIVTVELVPRTADAQKRPPETSIKESWADTTRLTDAYFPETRESLQNTIRNMPTASLTDAGLKPRIALTNGATVQNPPSIDGVGAWSIERFIGPQLDDESNCDQTLFAGRSKTSTDDGFVRIFDSAGKLKAAIPIPGSIVMARWSGVANDLIAVSSWVGQLDTSNSNRNAITVWQITETGARLLRTLRCSNDSFNWDAGYRIISFIDDHLTATRIDNQQSWKLTENTKGEFLLEDAISPDGRFVATYSVAMNTQISIWDLSTDSLRMAIPGGSSFRWASDSKRIAVNTQNQTNQLEIWDVGRREMEKPFPVESHKSAIDADLKTIATKSRKGVVYLTDTRTRRQRAFQLPKEFIAGHERSFRLQWNAKNQLQVWTKTSSMILNQTDDGNGNFIRIEDEKGFARPSFARFEFTGMQVKELDRLDIFGLRNPNDGDAAFRIKVDLTENQIIDNKSFSSLKFPEVGFSQSMFRRNGMPTMVSPNGQFMLTWARKKSRVHSSNEKKHLQIVNLDKPEMPLSIMDVAAIEQILWSGDGQRLVVRSNEWNRMNGQTKIVDLKNWRIIGESSLSNKKVFSIHEWNNGFVFRILMKRTRIENFPSQIGYLSNEPNAKFQTLDGVFNSLNFLNFNETEVILSGELFNKKQTKNQTNHPVQFFQLTSDLKLKVIPAPFDSPTNEPWNKYHSFDRKYRVEYVVEEEKSGLKRGKHVIFRSSQEDSETTDSEMYSHEHRMDDFQWHPKANAALWRENISDWMFFDPDSQSKPKRKSGIRFSTPLENGWLIATAQTIRHVGFDGSPIAELSFDQNEAGEISNPVWILADGSVIGNHDSLHITYEADDQIKTEPLAEFSNRSAKSDLPKIAEGRLKIRPIIVQPTKD